MFKKLNKNLISALFILFVIYVTIYINNRVLNDDFVLELCYSGYFSGGLPVSDHLFQHFFLTQTFSYLYTYFNYLNWYFYLHLFFLALSFLTILNVLKNSKNKYYIFILVVILFFIEYIYFTYTRISFYVTFSGFLFFLKQDKLDKYKLISSFLMVFLGSIIRPESGFLALILFSLLFISDDNFKKKIVDKSILKQLMIVTVIPLMILVTHHISNLENSKRFLVSNLSITESNLYRSSSFDNEIFDFFDYARLKQFYFDERFTSEEVVNHVKDKYEKISYTDRLKISIDSLIVFLTNKIYIFIFIAIMLQVFSVNGYFNKIKLFSILVFLILFLIGLNVFLDLALFKDRVFQPLLFSLIISFFVKDFAYESRINIYIVLMILIMFFFVLISSIRRDGYIEQAESLKKELDKVYNRLPNDEIIFDPTLFSVKTVLPGYSRVGESENFKSHQLLPLGWAQRSYSSKFLYSKMGVKRMDDLLVLPNVTVLLETGYLFLWNNYGEKYLNRSLVPYDSVCINDGQSCYYLAKYRPFLIK